MTKLSDFPVYGILSDLDGKPITLGHENLYSLLIEFDYASALATAENLAVISKSQKMPGDNYSSQIRIEKLFNISQILDFRRSYDYNSLDESLGYSQLKFTHSKLDVPPIINKIEFNPWKDEESFLTYG